MRIEQGTNLKNNNAKSGNVVKHLSVVIFTNMFLLDSFWYCLKFGTCWVLCVQSPSQLGNINCNPNQFSAGSTTFYNSHPRNEKNFN